MESSQYHQQNADHTRQLDPLSPTIGDHRPRKTVRKTNIPIPALPYGEALRTTKTVSNALQQGIEATVTEARRAEQILKDYASQFDNFSAGYTTQQDQLLAEEISKSVGDSLVHFYQRKFGTARATDTSRAPSAPFHASYAEKLKQNTSNNAPADPKSSENGKSKTVPTKQPPKSREDRRVIVTLPHQALLNREVPYILKRRLVQEIQKLTLSAVVDVSPTRTGWAIHLVDAATRDSLMSETNLPLVLKVFGGINAHIPENWYTYVVPYVPTTFTSILNGESVEITPQLIAEEVLAQLGETPVRCALSQHGVNPMTRKATWVISFKKEVRNFHLFSFECSSHLVQRKAKITHHGNGCQGWCNPLKCHRTARCNNCGTEIHKHADDLIGNQCPRPSRCANCFGPHKAGHESCPAKPRSKQGRIVKPSKIELQRIRAASMLVVRATRNHPTSSGSSTDTLSEDMSRPSSPSPTAPNTRKRGAVIDEYEQRGSAIQVPSTFVQVPSTLTRSSRIGKNTANMNLAKMSRASTAMNLSKASAATKGRTSTLSSKTSSNSNSFDALSSTDMEIDATIAGTV